MFFATTLSEAELMKIVRLFVLRFGKFPPNGLKDFRAEKKSCVMKAKLVKFKAALMKVFFFILPHEKSSRENPKNIQAFQANGIDSSETSSSPSPADELE